MHSGQTEGQACGPGRTAREGGRHETIGSIGGWAGTALGPRLGGLETTATQASQKTVGIITFREEGSFESCGFPIPLF